VRKARYKEGGTRSQKPAIPTSIEGLIARSAQDLDCHAVLISKISEYVTRQPRVAMGLWFQHVGMLQARCESLVLSSPYVNWMNSKNDAALGREHGRKVCGDDRKRISREAS
jgi:hypothetical protein